MASFRDVVLKRQARESIKQDKLPFKRAVLVNQYGEQTSSSPMDDVWAVEGERRVFYMVDGGAAPAQILCRKVSDPYVGLGVIIGYADNSNQIEVLSDDFFLTQTGDPTGWASTSPRDFEPGGIKQMWVYTKVITPIMTFPVAGLFVNVTSGDYVYAGVRLTFPGYLGFPLTVPGTPGEHYLAGLYIDNANTLQVVYGTAVVIATTAPEPAWPAGAFRLSAILLENGQTTIDFDDDVFDRRLVWSDENSSGGGWPFAHVLTVSTTDPDADYSTITAAIAGASSSDGVLLDGETFNEVVTLNKFLYVKGFDRAISIISRKITSSVSGSLEKLQVFTASDAEALEITTTNNSRIIDCKFVVSASANPKVMYVRKDTDIINCSAQGTTSGSQYALYVSPASGTATVNVYDGLFRGGTADVYADTSATINLFGPVLYNASPVFIPIAGPGIIRGYYYDLKGTMYQVQVRKYYQSFQLMGS